MRQSREIERAASVAPLKTRAILNPISVLWTTACSTRGVFVSRSVTTALNSLPIDSSGPTTTRSAASVRKSMYDSTSSMVPPCTSSSTTLKTIVPSSAWTRHNQLSAAPSCVAPYPTPHIRSILYASLRQSFSAAASDVSAGPQSPWPSATSIDRSQ